MTRTVFTGATIFDSVAAELRSADVAVENGLFVEVGDGLRGDVKVDVAGLTLLPGMFDCHVHVLGVQMQVKNRLEEPFSYQFYNAKRNLERTLECGITTVRDCAGADLGVKKALQDGLVNGPRLQVSITALSQTGGHMDGTTPSSHWVDPFYIPHPGRPSSVADGVDGVRKLARQSLRAGADFLKVLATHSGHSDYNRTRFSPAELQAIGDEARANRVGFAAHAYGSAAVKDAVRAGATTIEHVADLDDEAIELMRANGTWLVPTLARLAKSLPDGPLFDAGPERDRLGHQGVDHDKVLLAQTAIDSVKRASERGVNIAMGTDSGNNAGQNLDELLALEMAGLDAARVLVSVTLGSAKAIGLDHELGSIEVGKRADMVVVQGDVFKFAELKNNITAVYMDGRLVHGQR